MIYWKGFKNNFEINNEKKRSKGPSVVGTFYLWINTPTTLAFFLSYWPTPICLSSYIPIYYSHQGCNAIDDW
jgi:hypothetical protein